MTSNAIFAEIAALAGDPARAGMLHALMDGRALTASELARVAGIAPQTASGHLTRMTAAGLLSVEKQGRHRYHRLASPGVAHMMESIMQVASDLEPPRKRLTVGPREAVDGPGSCHLDFEFERAVDHCFNGGTRGMVVLMDEQGGPNLQDSSNQLLSPGLIARCIT